MAKQVNTKWKKNKGFKKPFDYHLEESDQDLTLHRLDMPDLLKLGVSNEMDFMTKALMGSSGDEQKAKDAVANAVLQGDNFTRMEVMINKICVAGIVDPVVLHAPLDEADRDENLFYVDEIPWDDRMELFSVIFESDGISDFREEQEPGVGDVANVQDVQLPADGPVADVPSGNPEGVLSQ